MITVTILGFDYVLGGSLMGISDLFRLAGVSWNRIHQQEPEHRFRVQVASWDKAPIRCLNDVLISPHCALQDIEHSDVFLIPAIAGNIEQTLDDNWRLVECLKAAGDSRCLIGSNSTGAFFLGESGLLNGKNATTHWGMVDLFRQRYPEVNLKPDQLITHDGNILCDGGGLAWFDLGLYIVELFCGHETAVGLSKAFVLDTLRPSQLTYSPLISKKYHGDTVVFAVQSWMEDNLSKPVRIDSLGEQFGISNRSLIRRFKAATGITPLAYLQEARLEAARKLLVQSHKTIDEITRAVGYEDISSFTRLFKRKNDMPPSDYRARFRLY